MSSFDRLSSFVSLQQKINEANDPQVKLERQYKELAGLNAKINELNEKLPTEENVREKQLHWENQYKKAEDIGILDTLLQKKDELQRNIDLIEANPTQLHQHQHDHRFEKRLMEKSEEDKIKLCNSYYIFGLQTLQEGRFVDSIEQFRLMLSTANYCFPVDESQNKELDSLRLMTIYYLALVYYTVKEYRESMKLIDEFLSLGQGDQLKVVKSLFLRAKCWKRLFEYELALQDLHTCLTIQPDAAFVLEEIGKTKVEIANAAKTEKERFNKIFRSTADSDKSVPTAVKLTKNSSDSLKNEDGMIHPWLNMRVPIELNFTLSQSPDEEKEV